MRKLFGGLAVLAVPAAAMAMSGLGGRTAPSPTSNVCDTIERGQLPGLAGDILEQCGFACAPFTVDGEAEANVTGVRGLDAFFAATLSFRGQAASLQADVRAELASIATALGLEVSATASVTELAAAIEAEFTGTAQGDLVASLQGGLEVSFTPPRCEVSASASLEAAARCDATVVPGSAMVMCSGACEAEASAMLECTGSATLMCRGTAPSFDCTGTCQGSCVVEAGAACEGECQGTCMLEAPAVCDGECLGTLNGINCTGECQLRAGASCSGMCMGSCELTGGAECEGECRGECTYEPGGATCDAGATARCEAAANAMVMCNGRCEGEVVPPMVSAECEATAMAEAMFAAECFPPAVDVRYTLTTAANVAFDAMADGGVAARAVFEGRIRAIGRAFANIGALRAKAVAVVSAGPGLVQAAAGAVGSTIATLGSSANLQASFKATTCAPGALEVSATLIGNATTDLNATATAVADVSAALTGS